MTEPSQESLEARIRAARSGDGSAFESLYRESVPTVTAVCMKYLKNDDEVEDAIQDTYLSIFQSLDRLKKPEAFLSWARQIAIYRCVDRIRRKIADREVLEFRPNTSDQYLSMEDLRVETNRTEVDPEQKVDQDEMAALMRDAIGSLNDFQRACMILWCEEYSYQEIAEMLGVPVGSVKSGLFYSKRKVRTELEKIGRREHIDFHGMAMIPAFREILNGLTALELPEYTANSSFFRGLMAKASELGLMTPGEHPVSTPTENGGEAPPSDPHDGSGKRNGRRGLTRFQKETLTSWAMVGLMTAVLILLTWRVVHPPESDPPEVTTSRWTTSVSIPENTSAAPSMTVPPETNRTATSPVEPSVSPDNTRQSERSHSRTSLFDRKKEQKTSTEKAVSRKTTTTRKTTVDKSETKGRHGAASERSTTAHPATRKETTVATTKPTTTKATTKATTKKTTTKKYEAEFSFRRHW